MTDRSPLLDLPGAVAGNGIDAPVAAHYGSFHGEQRTLESGEGFVDLSHRGVVRVSGPDRLTWLHSLTSQFFEGLAPSTPIGALILSPQGHVEHAMFGSDDGEAFTAHVEPGEAPALVEWLDRMRFMMRVEVADVTDEIAVVWRPLGPERSSRPGWSSLSRPPTPATCSSPARTSAPSPTPPARPAACGPSRHCGSRAASRVSGSTPTTGRSPTRQAGSGPPYTSTRAATAARRPWRASTRWAGRRARLTLLHLDGSDNRLPAQGSDLVLDGKTVGFVGSSARHHELGPIALGMVKRNVSLDATLVADGIAAAQEVLVDPEVGLHVRPAPLTWARAAPYDPGRTPADREGVWRQRRDALVVCRRSPTTKPR